MKYIQTYEAFRGQDFLKDPVEIKAWLDKMGIKKYTIGKDGKVDVNRGVDISGKKLDRIPVQFGVVEGSFSCSGNQLTNLQGAPESVGGYFYCSNNQLTNLQGSPENVGGYFDCHSNQLTSLQGFPKKLKGIFYCEYNRGLPSEFLEKVAKLIQKGKSDWDTEIRKLVKEDPTAVNVLPKEELKRLGLDKENKLKSTGLL